MGKKICKVRYEVYGRIRGVEFLVQQPDTESIDDDTYHHRLTFDRMRRTHSK